MSVRMLNLDLTEQQEAEAQRIYERVRGAMDEEIQQMARLLASKENGQLLGQTEYEIRDRVHRMGAQMLESAVDERQKKGRLRRC